MSTHTPGPWVLQFNKYATGATVRSGTTGMPIAWCSAAAVQPERNHALEQHEATANARLIAAAPDLLTALTDLLARDEFDARVRGVSERRKPAEDAARAALAKARG